MPLALHPLRHCMPVATQLSGSFLGLRSWGWCWDCADDADVPHDGLAAQQLEARPRQQPAPLRAAPLTTPARSHHLQVHGQRHRQAQRRSGGGMAVRRYGHHVLDQQQPGARGGERGQYVAEDAGAVLCECVGGGEGQCGCKKGGGGTRPFCAAGECT